MDRGKILILSKQRLQGTLCVTRVNALLFSAAKLKAFFGANFIFMTIKNNKCVKSKYILIEKLFKRIKNTGTASTLVSIIIKLAFL